MCDEIAPFGLNPVNLTVAGSAAKRARELQKLNRRLRMGVSNVEAVVVSHDTLCTPEFMEAVKRFDCSRLLIADEAHNLGRPAFVNHPPEFFDYRLGLSATRYGNMMRKAQKHCSIFSDRWFSNSRSKKQSVAALLNTITTSTLSISPTARWTTGSL